MRACTLWLLVQSAPEDHPYLRMHRVDVALYDIDNDGALVAGDILPVQIEGARTEVAVPPGRACPLLVNPNHNDWTFAKIALRDEDAVVLREQLGDIEDPMSRSIFLAALFDKSMSGGMPVADYVRQALRLAETEENMRVLEQIASSLAEAAGMMKRLRPETDKALPRLLDDIEALGLRRSHFAQTHDLKHMWLNMFLNVVSSNAGVGTARALLDGRAEIDGIEISPEIRWRLLTILSRHGAPDIAKLLEEELSRDPSDFGARSALSVRAAVPDAAVKERWLAELQNPQSTTSLARQRAVMHELFPANQTNLQLEVLPIILGALPQMSAYADPYFMRTYTESLLTPMCQPESTAQLKSAALDNYAGQLNPTDTAIPARGTPGRRGMPIDTCCTIGTSNGDQHGTNNCTTDIRHGRSNQQRTTRMERRRTSQVSAEPIPGQIPTSCCWAPSPPAPVSRSPGIAGTKGWT